MSGLPGSPLLLYVRPAKPPQAVADLRTKFDGVGLALPSIEPSGTASIGRCELRTGPRASMRLLPVLVAHAGDFSLHDLAIANKGPGRPEGNLEARALFVPIWVKGVGIEIGRERDR